MRVPFIRGLKLRQKEKRSSKKRLNISDSPNNLGFREAQFRGL